MNDFRSRRLKLPPEAFAISSGSEPSPSDPLDDATWRGIVFLPDDVSLRTSDHHGETLRRAYEGWGNWVGLILDVQSLCNEPTRDPLAVATGNASDEFQASIYAALTGFYRQAIGSLRPALEAMLAAVYFTAHPDHDAVAQWLEGHEDGRFWIRRVRLQLANEEPFCRFERSEGELFADGGWFAWLYGILSAYLHGRPAFTDQAGTRLETTNAGLWNSNGPIYSEEAFVLWSRVFFDTLLLSALFVGLADTRIVHLERPSDIPYESFIERLIDWYPVPGAPNVAAAIAEYLMPAELG
jgi:hypothetical protein